MMTRDEFLSFLMSAIHVRSIAELNMDSRKLADHDQAQREKIARLEVEHTDLVLRNRILRERPDLPLERLRAYNSSGESEVRDDG